MLTDLLLAIGHHLLFLALFAILVMELMLVRPDMPAATIRRLGRLDAAYGIVALAILAVGFGRVFFGAKPWEFYVYNWVFWAKIAAFAGVGILSAAPTIRIAHWRAALANDPGFRPGAADVAATRQLMHAEATVFALIPIFATLMARGYGL